jgi:capsular polysaccharide transport system permease protein
MKVGSVFTPFRLATGIIFIPMVAAAIYLVFLASPRYVTQTVVSVRSATVPNSPLTAGVVGTGSPTPLSYQDDLFLYYFLQGPGVLETLDKKLGLRQHFESPKWDFVFRLWKNTSKEWFLYYFQQVLTLSFDDQSGLLTISSQAFSPEMSRKLSQAILDACEDFVNEYSNRVAAEQMAFTERESRASAQRLQEANNKLVTFQTENKLLDPVAQSAATTALFATLQASLATEESQLKSLTAYLQEDSYQVQALQAQITATRSQLETERLRSTANASGDRLNTLMVQYQTLQLEAGFAATDYASAVAALQAARIDAARKLWSVVVVGRPVTPQSAQNPQRLFDLTTLFVLCVLTYTIARLTVLTIQEHQD